MCLLTRKRATGRRRDGALPTPLILLCSLEKLVGSNCDVGAHTHTHTNSYIPVSRLHKLKLPIIA